MKHSSGCRILDRCGEYNFQNHKKLLLSFLSFILFHFYEKLLSCTSFIFNTLNISHFEFFMFEIHYISNITHLYNFIFSVEIFKEAVFNVFKQKNIMMY